MVLIGFRHGLQASEAVDLRWDQVNFHCAVLHVRRSKGGTQPHKNIQHTVRYTELAPDFGRTN
jgi:hypothetical protein